MPAQPEEITIAVFYDLWNDGEMFDVVVVKNRIIGKTKIGQADTPKGYKVVYANLPP